MGIICIDLCFHGTPDYKNITPQEDHTRSLIFFFFLRGTERLNLLQLQHEYLIKEPFLKKHLFYL